MRFINLFFLVLIVIANLLFAWFVYHVSFNIPFYDDFDAIGGFILQIKQSSVWHYVPRLWDQYAEHRIAYTRLIVLMQYLLTGQVNFQVLICIGLLGLLGTQWVLYKHNPLISQSPLLFIPIVLILLNFQYWENLNSAMTALQNLNAPFFVLLFLYVLVHYPAHWLVYALAALALGTSGNGIICFVLGALYFPLMRLPRRKLWQWLIFSMILICLYFYDYQRLPTNFGGRSNMLAALAHPSELIAHFCMFLTSNLQHYDAANFRLHYVVGGLVIVFGLYFCARMLLDFSKFSTKERFLFLCWLYLFATAALVVLNRASLDENMFFSRYRIYSSLVFCTVYVSLLALWPRFRIWYFGFFVVAALHVGFTALYYAGTLINQTQELRWGAVNYHANQKQWLGLYPKHTPYFTDATKAEAITHGLEKAGIYQVPREALTNLPPLSMHVDTLPMHVTDIKGNFYRFSNDSLTFSWRNENVALLMAEKKQIYVPLNYGWGAKPLFSLAIGRPFSIRGFAIHVSQRHNEPGKYRLYVFLNATWYFVKEVTV